ncbi:MAG: diguanylate cyclase, partial [Cyanobacteria bacterium J06635_15]
MSKTQQAASRYQISLRLILIVPFVVQIFTAVGLVGWLSWRSGQRAVNDLVTNLGHEITARVHQKLANHLEIAETVVQLNIDAVQLEALDLDQHPEAAAYLFQQLLRFPQLTGVTLATEAPNYVGIAEANDGTRVLTLWNRSDVGVVDYFLDGKGQIVAISKVDQDYDHRQRPWYVNPTIAGIAQWQAPYLTINPVRLTISIDQPFYDQVGNLLGVSDAELSLASISDFLSTLKVGKTGQVFIIERTGHLVATSSDQLPYQLNPETEEPERISAGDSDDRLVARTTEFLHQKFEGLDQIQDNQQLSFRLDGQCQFVQVMPFHLTEGMDWLVVIAVPESDFMGEIHRNRQITVTLCGAALLLATGLGLLTTRWLVHPVQTLALAANGLSQGKWQQPVPLPRVQELAWLAQAFNRMARQLQSYFQKLEYSAYHDALTGLTNRNGLQAALQAAIDQYDGNLFAVFLLDVDNFKLINDSFGHLVGDQLLVAIADRLKQILATATVLPPQTQITLARFGGDEFFILVNPVTDVTQAIGVASHLLANFHSPFTIDNREFFIKTSIGIVLSPVGGDQPESFLRNADIALYAAKNAGKASYKVFDAKMHAIAVERLQIETDLHHALKQQEFILHYQSVVDLKTFEIKGFEALIRWQHPHQGLMPPTCF